jgi:hypothetical protein
MQEIPVNSPEDNTLVVRTINGLERTSFVGNALLGGGLFYTLEALSGGLSGDIYKAAACSLGAAAEIYRCNKGTSEKVQQMADNTRHLLARNIDRISILGGAFLVAGLGYLVRYAINGESDHLSNGFFYGSIGSIECIRYWRTHAPTNE